MDSLHIEGTAAFLNVEQGHVVVGGSLELVYTTKTSQDEVKVEGNVEHAHVNAGTDSATAATALSTDTVKFDYDGNSAQSSDESVWETVQHHTGDSTDPKATATNWSTDSEGNADFSKMSEVATSSASEELSKTCTHNYNDDWHCTICGLTNIAVNTSTNTPYTTLKEACSVAEAGQYVKLLKDTSERINVISKAIILDLNNHVLTTQAVQSGSLYYGVAFTSQDVTTVKNGTIDSTNKTKSGTVLFCCGGNLKLEDVTVNSGAAMILLNNNGGTATIGNGCNFSASGGSYGIQNISTLNIEDGAVINLNNTSLYGIYNPSGATLNIKGGSIVLDGTGCYGVYNNGTWNMTGGSITTGEDYSIIWGAFVQTQGTCTISGGTISGSGIENDYTNFFSIAGGTFTFSGATINSDMNWSGGTITISSGTMNVSRWDIGGVTLKITGGTFNYSGTNTGIISKLQGCVQSGCTVSINGESYSKE